MSTELYPEEPIINRNNDKQLTQYFLRFPPYWQRLEDKTFSGLHYRLAQKVFEHAGLAVKFINVPYQRMQFQVQQGEIPFINYGEIEGVNTDDILHICIPPTTITLRVYYLDTSLAEVDTLAGFSQQKVIIMHGLPLGEFEEIKADPSISFMRPRSIKSAIEGLKIGRGDYFIVFDNLVESVQNTRLKTDIKMLKSYPLYSLLGYPVTTPKSYPGGKALCNKVFSSYLELVEEGVINADHIMLTSDLK